MTASPSYENAQSKRYKVTIDEDEYDNSGITNRDWFKPSVASLSTYPEELDNKMIGYIYNNQYISLSFWVTKITLA